jgi:hypothetical protein
MNQKYVMLDVPTDQPTRKRGNEMKVLTNVHLKLVLGFYTMFIVAGLALAVFQIYAGLAIGYVVPVVALILIISTYNLRRGVNWARISLLIHSVIVSISALALIFFYSKISLVLSALYLLFLAPFAWCAYVLQFSKQLRSELVSRARAETQRHQAWIQEMEEKERNLA